MSKRIECVSYEDIPEYTGLEKNTTSITVKDDCLWEGDRYGTYVGCIKDDGTVDSAFVIDNKNGNTEVFDRLRKDIRLYEKRCSKFDRKNGNLFSVTEYYIPYKVKDHVSDKATVTNSYVDNCMNVKYKVEYYVLLVTEEDFRRYLIFTYDTEGTWASHPFDQLEYIESTFEEYFDEESHDFKKNEDGEMSVAFYDGTGEKLFIQVDSVRELLDMITEFRVTKVERKKFK